MQFPIFPEGDYSLQAIATGFFTDISINNLQLKTGDTRETALVILRVSPADATILGQVVDKSNGQSLLDTEIQVECSTGVCAPLSSESNQEGKFSIEIWFGLGSNIKVRGLGYRTKPIHVKTLKPTQKLNLKQIVLERVAQ